MTTRLYLGIDEVSGLPNFQIVPNYDLPWFSAAIAAANSTQDVAELLAIRLKRDQSMPMVFFVTLTGCLVFFILLDLPRTLARFTASLPMKYRPAILAKWGFSGRGGEFGKGWTMSAGRTREEEEELREKKREKQRLLDEKEKERVDKEKESSAGESNSSTESDSDKGTIAVVEKPLLNRRFMDVISDERKASPDEEKIISRKLSLGMMAIQEEEEEEEENAQPSFTVMINRTGAVVPQLPAMNWASGYGSDTFGGALEDKDAITPAPAVPGSNLPQPTAPGRRISILEPAMPRRLSSLDPKAGPPPRKSSLENSPERSKDPLTPSSEHRRFSWGRRRSSAKSESPSERLTGRWATSMFSFIDRRLSTQPTIPQLRRSISEASRTTHQPPSYVPPILSYLPFSPYYLTYTPYPNYFPHMTVGNAIVIGIYLFLILMVVFMKAPLSFNTDVNPAGPDVVRSGLMATAQIPIVIALGGRNGVVRWLLSASENSAVQRIHKIVGKGIFACTLLHVGLWMRKWTIQGRLAEFSAMPYVIAGYISTAALCVLVITSIPAIRKSLHTVFSIGHTLGMFGFLIGLILHVKQAIPWVAVSFAIYALDWAGRIVKTKYEEAGLKVMEGNTTTIIQVDGLREGWRAGQYVVIRVPALRGKLGWKGWEAHPFTIATAPETDGLVLMAKNVGDWTDALYEMASRGSDISIEKGGDEVKTMILVEGPYGGPGHTMFSAYDNFLLIAAGSGITYALGVAQDLIAKSVSQNCVRAKIVDLVWLVRTQDIARPMVRFLRALVEAAKQAERQSVDGGATALRVHIYVTRSPAFSPMNLKGVRHTSFDVSQLTKAGRRKSSALQLAGVNLPVVISDAQRRASVAEGVSKRAFKHTASFNSDIEVSSKKPSMAEIVEVAVGVAAAAQRGPNEGNGFGVAVCGPAAVVTDVRSAVRGIDEEMRVRLGGIDLHEEFFGY